MQSFSKDVPKYFDLTKISKLTADLLSDAGDKHEARFKLFVTNEKHPYEELARFVEFTVFHHQFDYSYQSYHAHYAKYGHSSTFIIVVDTDEKIPMGSIRINVDSHEGFPAERILREVWNEEGMLEKLSIDRKDVAEIVTWSVLPEYRGGEGNRISMQLLSECLTQVSLVMRKSYMIAVMDLHPLKIIQQLGEPFKTMNNLSALDYDGSLCLPVYMHIPKTIERIRKDRPDIYGMLLGEKG